MLKNLETNTVLSELLMHFRYPTQTFDELLEELKVTPMELIANLGFTEEDFKTIVKSVQASGIEENKLIWIFHNRACAVEVHEIIKLRYPDSNVTLPLDDRPLISTSIIGMTGILLAVLMELKYHHDAGML